MVWLASDRSSIITAHWLQMHGYDHFSEFLIRTKSTSFSP